MSISSLGPYLKEIDEEQLNHILEEVLSECRRREAEKLRKEILTNSQAIRLGKRPSQ